MTRYISIGDHDFCNLEPHPIAIETMVNSVLQLSAIQLESLVSFSSGIFYPSAVE